MADASSAEFSCTHALTAELQDLVDASRLPGAFVMIERDGALIDSAIVGWQSGEHRVPLQVDSISRLYSMSKPITSFAILMLADQGELALDDPVSIFLPGFSEMRVYISGEPEAMVTEPVKRQITLRDLLLHDSGIVYHFTGDSPVHKYYRKNGVMRDTPVGRLPGDGDPATSLKKLVSEIFAPNYALSAQIEPDLASATVSRSVMRNRRTVTATPQAQWVGQGPVIPTSSLTRIQDSSCCS